MGLFSNKEPTVTVTVTDVERKIILNALEHLRNEQIRKNKNYDFIETIMYKVAYPTDTKGKGKIHEER